MEDQKPFENQEEPTSNEGQQTPEPNENPTPSDPETANESEEEERPQTESPEAVNTPASEMSSSSTYWQRSGLELDTLHKTVDQVKQQIGKVVVGQEGVIDLMLAAMFTGGHVLMEGVPGIAKTLTSRLLAKTLDVGFSRIQFTPDLMPADVTGTNIFNVKSSEFIFAQGPIFSNIVLIDEINRAPAKTQAALFEVMEEKQITIDGKTYKMDFPFFVMATQNPVEQEGTYKLPEAQLDRFLFKIKLTYPELEDEIAILMRFKNDFAQKVANDVNAVFDEKILQTCSETIEKVHIQDQLVEYIAKIINNTRNNGDLFLGASPRASLAILKTSKAIAAMAGRDFVTPDDIQYVSIPVLRHRIILSPDREMEGIEPEDIITEIVKKIEVPR